MAAACSQYFNELDNKIKSRYEEKIAECGGVDPYSNLTLFDDDIFEWPPVNYIDIVNYLVFSTSFVSGRQMKAYKSLTSYNFFVSGWVRNVTVRKADKGRRILFARVNHSQRANETPLKTWVLIEGDGEVVTAHCDCMAGLSEVCSHVGAVLFALEAGTRMRDQQTCTEKSCQWVLPTSLKQVPYVEARTIDFTSAQKKKKDFDNDLTSPTALRRVNLQPHIQGCKPTEEEKLQLLTTVHQAGDKSAILTVVPGFCEEFVPKQKLPIDLTTLFSVEALELQFHDLVQHCEALKEQVKVTEEMVENVEKLTRDQASSKEWFSHRAGRITASRMKAACHTDPANPSVSLIKSICYPNPYGFSTKATRWGCDHEKDARALYSATRTLQHDNFTIKDSGLCLHPDYPHLGASPDGVVSCTCCGNGVCEIKCPFCFKDETIKQAADNKKSCIQDTDDGIRLDRNHAYYYQVQCQIFMCKANYCDFVMFTNKELSVERIYPDGEFWESLVEKSTQLFKVAILPELVGKWFTTKVSKAPVRHGENEYCYCKGDEHGVMVGCDNDECAWQWFHIDCLGLKSAPKSKTWLCPTCRKIHELKKRKRAPTRKKAPLKDSN